MLEDLDQIFAWLLATLIRPTSGLYGEFDLRDDDRDPRDGVTARYGGRERPGLTGTTHVRDLHRDLRELGFLLAPEDATTFTRDTRWAVQEFQRYASLPDSAAQRRPDSATLVTDLTAAHGALQVSALSAFPGVPPFRVRIDAEILEVTGVRGELTVTRGAQDTTAAAHAVGAVVEPIRWSDRLVPVVAHFYERYTEAITGVVNPWTRFVLRRWKQARRRCPIVVEAWQLQQGQPDRLHTLPAAGNVWGHRDVPVKALRFYVRDLTRTWRRPARPPSAPAHPELDVTGEFATYLQDWSGPRAWPNFGHTWRPEAEMLPEHLLPVRAGGTGPTLAELMADAAGLSTYKVVRAVAEVEAVGFFDGLNGYDPAFVSLGPCHWTAGAASGPAAGGSVDAGELWGYLAYLKSADPAAFEQTVGRYGVSVADWGHNGGDLFLPGQRKYVSRPTVPQEGGPARLLPQVVEEFDVFRGWHWFYRFQMATRTVEGFRRRMWHMARLRIRDIMRTPWDGPEGPPTWVVPDPQAPGGTRPALVQDVITSERGLAMVYRWHIKRPANMVSGGPASEPAESRRIGRAGPQLRTAVEEAVTDDKALFAGTPDQWGDDAERALIEHLTTRAKRLSPADAGLVGSLQYVIDWPAYGANPRGYTLPVEILPEAEDGQGRRLRTARRSFTFDAGDLPLPAL
ncbi:peptidoglycan-binding domain-containing protein [Nonomuraea sp. NPDC050643]|uniref:peptidoglycan-binding domain-containing protein n=1 Tax=Nonomuraea sp. NPDC050643 TaxID=3155660 RepID=UPI003400CE0F